MLAWVMNLGFAGNESTGQAIPASEYVYKSCAVVTPTFSPCIEPGSRPTFSGDGTGSADTPSYTDGHVTGTWESPE